MFFFTPIFATLTSVAVLISNNVVANIANPISHESRQTPGCTYNNTGDNTAYEIQIPTPFIGSDACAGLFNFINSGQWSLDPNFPLPSPAATNNTGFPITNWESPFLATILPLDFQILLRVQLKWTWGCYQSGIQNGCFASGRLPCSLEFQVSLPEARTCASAA
ncbi:hypothetical protein V8E54_001076 [Elaphomyces granulatus]|jgi:hypothetical protein